MKKIFNGMRLKEARLFNKLSITELAEKLNVTKQMISKYENGKSEPSFEKSLHLHEILGYPREFFYSKDLYEMENEGTFFRSRLTATQKSKEPATILLRYSVIVRDFLDQYLDFPQLQNREIYEFNGEYNQITMSIRENMELGDGPIQDVVEVAELMGFTVINTEYHEEKVDAFSSMYSINDKNYFIITTGESNSFYRQQFSIAHEIGHWVLHQSLDPQELDKEEYKVMEEEANNFASCFLLPKSSFGEDLRKRRVDEIDTYYNLKKYWKVSMAAMIKRAADLGIINADQVVKLYKQMNYRKWRNPEPFDLETPVTEPVTFQQAIELLIDEKVLAGHEIPTKIAEEYNLFLTKKMLAAVCGVSEVIFTNNMDSKVVIKIKDFKKED